MFPRWFVSLVLLLAAAPLADAQSLGTLRWQLQPYCNVVTVNVTGVAGGVYTIDGYDDQCGAPTRAPLTGVATPNLDGTIGFGLHVVTAPGGHGVQIDARITLTALSGPWTDSDGLSGTFAFGTSTGGSPRPLPVVTPIIPAAFGLGADGGFVAGGALGAGAIPASGAGTRMMWHPAKGAFRAGSVTDPSADAWDEPAIGQSSAAFGQNTRASGKGDFAAGVNTSATGSFSAAFGGSSQATAAFSLVAGESSLAAGRASIAVGQQVRALAPSSVALGLRTTAGGVGSLAAGSDSAATGNVSLAFGTTVASGNYAVAMGRNLDAAGESSVVLGTNVTTTAAAIGTFAFGDASTPNQLLAFLPNQFRVRASRGTFFYSSPDLSSGVVLGIGANAWSSLSDVNSKEHFRDLDGIDVLAKLAQMPIREWNYKAQDAAIRHVGPTAQDFHAAFGLGEDPLRISTIDADGIALAGVKALALENQSLKADLAALRARLDRLEGALTEPR